MIEIQSLVGKGAANIRVALVTMAGNRDSASGIGELREVLGLENVNLRKEACDTG